MGLATGTLEHPHRNAQAPGTRICIVLHDLRGGGAERACLRLARGMLAAKRDVDLVLVRGEGEYLSDIPAGANVTILDRPRVAQAVLPLRDHLRRTRPAAVLSALTHMNIAMIAATRLSGCGARVVVSERNQMGAKAREAEGLRQQSIYRAVPWFYRAADRVVAVSEGVAHDLVRFGGVSADKISVVHNPVFDSDIADLSTAQPEHSWFSDRTTPIILATGRLHKQKGFDLLLQAFARVRAKMDCRLVIAGEGGERDALTATVNQIGLAYDISMPGFVRNPLALMSRAAVFVLSSRWEGFPNALVEAMACGTPVVAADCLSGPREILDGGRYGRLVPPENVDALAAAILETLRGRGNIGAARRRAESFSVAAATKQYLELLEPAG
jgi:glycosyltransferase involved in cell wall biosynthesis